MTATTALSAVDPTNPPPAAGVPALSVSLVLGVGQELDHTRSRCAEPRAWLRSVQWLVNAGLHPRSGPATLAVAQDLASRMDYRRGLVMYGLDGTAQRTGLSRATVKRHVKVLRELGTLVWWRHGSKQNLRLPGRAYTATATIYAAVIPPNYDTAMGHRLAGAGYQARVCGVTDAGRELAVGQAMRTAKPVDNRPVDNPNSQAREPHSPGRNHQSPELQVESGSTDTSRKRASRSTTSPRPETNRSNSNSREPRRTARQVQRGIWITRQVRARVNWIQGERLRRLEFVLRPLLDAGLDADTIAAELHSWMLTWRPARPAEYIRVQLARQASAEHTAAALETSEPWGDDVAPRAFIAPRQELVRSVLDGLAAGLAAYSARQSEQGLDDLTDAAAASDMAAFLDTTTSTGVLA